MAKRIDYAALYTLRKDGRYMGYWHDLDGRRHAIYDRDPEALHRKIAEKERHEPEIPTFGQLADRWEVQHAEKLSRGSQMTYRAPLEYLRDEFGEMPVTEITAADVNRLMLRERNQGYSYKHAALLKSIIRQIMNLAIVERWITVNPTAAVAIQRGMKKGRVESPDELTMDAIQRNLDKPFGAFVAMLLYTGMRTEEAAALRWMDVGKDEITVRAAVDLHGSPVLKETKTEAGERQVPILTQHRPYLVRPTGAKPEDFVFNSGGKLLTRGQITSRWLTWCKAAGLAEQHTVTGRHRGDRECARTEWRPLVRPHQLRHHYATVLYEQGVDVLTAQDVMGHKDIETTRKIYTSLRQKHRNKEIKKIEGGF
jgi:integrase